MPDSTVSSRSELEASSFQPVPARLVMRLLGPPQVILEGKVVLGQRAQKALALLAFLALQPDRPHPRSMLAALFWPDKLEKQALQDLRQTLSRLRTAVGDRARSGDRTRSGDRAPSREDDAQQLYLLADPQSIQFNAQSDHWLDANAFRAVLSETEGHGHRRLDACPTCMSQLEGAAEWYRGEFLANLHPSGSPALGEWLLIRRERLQQQACVVLQALAGSHLARGEPDAAWSYARRLLILDPWNEAAQRLYLLALTQNEGRNTALRHFAEFCAALADELGVEPEDATLALVEQIRAGTLAEMEPRLPRVALPSPAVPFVGREAEKVRLADYLGTQDRRLITLYGPGGSGKSRLALEIAASQAPLWRDGLWFIPLAGVPPGDGLLDALATSLELRLPADSVDTRHLIDFLRPRELLLVLDGFEHMVDGVALLQEILRQATQVKILITSRTRLGLPGEWPVEVLGLDVPDGELAEVAQAQEHSAVQLFVQRARRVAPEFGLSPTNLPDIVRICQRVAGLPLGIELAAAWARLFPCRQIADEMEQSLDFLHSPDGQATDRHHSLRATFDYSCTLLSEAQRVNFRRLSVFRGGLTTGAAQQVAGTDPAGLVCLVDRSLLQLSPSRRLDMHLSLQEYAAEKLAEYPAEEAAVREQHGRYYLSFLRDREGALSGERPREAQDEIDGELGNIREAWRWAVAGVELEELGPSIAALSRFYDLRGLIREAEAVFGDAAHPLLPLVPNVAGARSIACRLLTEQARFRLHGADYARAAEAAEAATAEACLAGEPLCEAGVRQIWGEALWRQGDYQAARAELECALRLAREEQAAGAANLPAREVETRTLASLGAACWIHGEREQGRAYLQQALEIAQADNNLRARSKLLTNLGVCALEQGDYAEASDLLQQSLRIRQSMGDRRGEGITLGNLGNVYLYLGAYARAQAFYETALRIQREIGARNDEALSVGNLALVRHYLGEDAVSRDLCRQALQLAQKTGERRTEGAMWMKLGHALAGLGHLDQAARAYRESVGQRREMGWHNVAMEPLAGLAEVALAQGRLAEAQGYAGEIWTHLQTGTLEGTVSPFQVYLTCYHVFAAVEDPRAWDILGRAHGELQERAARISDEEMRRSFLERVQAHREILNVYQHERGAVPPQE